MVIESRRTYLYAWHDDESITKQFRSPLKVMSKAPHSKLVQ